MGIEKISAKLPKIATDLGKVKKISKINTIFDKMISKMNKSSLPEPKTRVEYALRRAAKKAQELRKVRENPDYAIKGLKKVMLEQANRTLTENFAFKKQNLMRELSKVCDENIMQRIAKADTPEKLAKILVNQDIEYIRNYLKLVMNNISLEAVCAGKKLPKFTLDIEQYVYKLRAKRTDFVLARERAMHVQSTNPQVIAIENILKEQYGAKFVSLKDNEELAKNVMKAFEVASEGGIQVPKNVIATDFLPAGGENLLYGEGSILLNPAKQAFKEGWCSTKAPYHAPLHEIMHGTHPKLISFSNKKLPEKYKSVKNNLSGYSANSPTHETFTELNTKRVVDGLNKEEQELFDYLNILEYV